MESLVDLCVGVLRDNIKYLKFYRLPIELHEEIIKKLINPEYVIKEVIDLNNVRCYLTNDRKDDPITFLQKMIEFKNCGIDFNELAKCYKNATYQEIIYATFLVRIGRIKSNEDSATAFINSLEFIINNSEFFGNPTRFTDEDQLINIFNKVKNPKIHEKTSKICFQLYNHKLVI